ncbi:DUF4962 domain-containing protein [Reinekea marinisedimentorum]|uniref:Uncharacterized protein DUF4962 n=1 Tax=Reinekea marinisedimentorum TaxID=230495 RepID=A0A4R3I3N5_9GAMM|nr:heparinase II/III family protein [Reinekea marinisedimentorum]TCS40445.1 uncharacterized protein DUF4962 [Reinekea marinisedimentorum]
MLSLNRTHDFQVNLSPSADYPATVNPPSFNWPQNRTGQKYHLELKSLSNGEEWYFEPVSSPVQLSFQLAPGQYQWRLTTLSEAEATESSEWTRFDITESLANYCAPTATELFELCNGKDQWLMYLDDDIEQIKHNSADIYRKLKQTTALSVPMNDIRYPSHYQRGEEEGKREAIANSRLWIDRDLMAHTLLYRIWGEEEHGHEARKRLLQLAEWSPEGPASLLRPCTWGDEVGCSLSRNLFLAYHWLRPLLNDNEKWFIRPMLVRIGKQLRQRLAEDEFEQYPGHSHTSRLPSYLGLAALTLYREHDIDECEQWLSYALMIYRGILPFYGGIDGSWAEGPFYASTYTKWYHPFFLSVERLSGFSFYNHPFYKNFLNFARDFIAPEQSIHPFGDGFWCRRDGKEWPGFFSQNPLRIYATRFGTAQDIELSQQLENAIDDYQLHLLDVIPTVNQLAFEQQAQSRVPASSSNRESEQINNYYGVAGLGKCAQGSLSLFYRASAFGNSSHRHGDQGNIALFDDGAGVLIPTGSYGYKFGSKHHKEWTRQTLAHNLPLIGQQGQKLDDQSAVATINQRTTEPGFQLVDLDLSAAYGEPLAQFRRKMVLVNDYGLILIDAISLDKPEAVNWRLHSELTATASEQTSIVTLKNPNGDNYHYQCQLLSHTDVTATLAHGYEDDLLLPERAIESDASSEVVHINWRLQQNTEHLVLACCINEGAALPCVKYSENKLAIEVTINDRLISVPVSE